jgi:hypothetical protein
MARTSGSPNKEPRRGHSTFRQEMAEVTVQRRVDEIERERQAAEKARDKAQAELAEMKQQLSEMRRSPIETEMDEQRDKVVVKPIPGFVPGLSAEDSAEAYDTKVHSLRMMEILLVSGKLTIGETIDLLKELARYQFKAANARSREKSKVEKSAAELLQELANG